MPINPSIPLQVQQYKAPDQMTTLGQLLGIKQAQSANALAELQMARQQKEDARQEILRSDLAGAVLPDGTIDQTKVRGALARAGDINALGTYDANQARIGASQAAMQKDRLAQATAALGYIGQELSGVRDQASFDVAKARVAQTLGPQWLQGVPDQYDPQWVQAQQQRALGMKDKIDLQLKQGEFEETKRHNQASEGIQREGLANKGPLAILQGADGATTVIGGPNGVGPNVTTQLGIAQGNAAQGKKFGEKAGEYFGAQYGEILKGGDDALLDNARLSRLDQLLTNVETGKFKGTTNELKRAAKAAGMDLESLGITDDVAPIEAAKVLSGQLTIDATKIAKLTPVSNADMAYMQTLQPGIETTPEGRKLMIQTRKAINDRQIEMQRQATKYRREHGQLDEGWTDQAREYAEKNPMFHAVTDDASFAQVPKGAYFLAPDGTVRQKQ